MVACIGLVMNINPAVNALESFIYRGILRPLRDKKQSTAKVNGKGDMKEPLLDGNDGSRKALDEDDDNQDTDNEDLYSFIPSWMRIAFVFLTLCITMYIACTVKDLAKVGGFLGGLFANSFMCLLPTIIYYKVRKKSEGDLMIHDGVCMTS
jgi:hypothetical protein